MYIIHDYRCQCGNILRDELEKPTSCPCNSPNFEVVFDQFKGLQSIREFKSESDRVDDKGFIRRAVVSDDPVCKIELGFQDDASCRGIRTFSPEQQRHYTEKLLVDGDTSKLRKEMLAVRAANEGKIT